MPQDLTDDKSTLVQVMAWCCQATSHYLNQCWPRSPTPYGVTRPQWVKSHLTTPPEKITIQVASRSFNVLASFWYPDNMVSEFCTSCLDVIFFFSPQLCNLRKKVNYKAILKMMSGRKKGSKIDFFPEHPNEYTPPPFQGVWQHMITQSEPGEHHVFHWLTHCGLVATSIDQGQH